MPAPETIRIGDLSTAYWAADVAKPVLHWGHATGFTGGTYAPLLAPLADAAHVYAWDARGHGHSQLPQDLTKLKDWNLFRDDMIEMLVYLTGKHGKKVLLAGHSMGATTSILVAAARPDLVAGLVLVDPVIIPRYMFYLARFLESFGMPNPGRKLGAQALKRRPHFPSRQEMHNSYHGRGPFKCDGFGFLDAYLDSAIKPSPAGVSLCCDPVWESATYQAQEHNGPAEIVRLNVPVRLLTPATGSTCYSMSAFRKLQNRQAGDVRVTTVADTTHFLPFENPAAVQEAIREICVAIDSH